MTAPEDAPRRPLPDRPSKEHLRKEAKRFAKTHALALGLAQRKLAAEYGYKTWSALMRVVDAKAPAKGRSPLSLAAARADEAAVRTLLAQGAGVDGEAHERDAPLFLVCDGTAPAEQRLAVAKLLLDAGAFTRGGNADGATPLHAAARRGPASLVRLLLRHGALFWQGDAAGARPYDYALNGDPVDRDEILYLLADKGPRTTDQGFLDAIAAIQSGDIATLGRLLDARPALLRERIIEPDIGTRGYFSDPKLFWFVANNPTLVKRSPDNIVEVAKVMLARGVDQADKDYALELVMTNGAFVGSQQIDLTATLIEAGAVATRQAILATLGHGQLAPVRWLLEHGYALTATIAAALGRVDALPVLAARASPDDITDALGMAVINRRHEAARLCLEAGADPDRRMAVHAHSTPAHQAAINNDVEMLTLLIAHGARLDIEDTLWRGRPLGWAIHGNCREAEAYLRRIMGLAERKDDGV